MSYWQWGLGEAEVVSQISNASHCTGVCRSLVNDVWLHERHHFSSWIHFWSQKCLTLYKDEQSKDQAQIPPNEVDSLDHQAVKESKMKPLGFFSRKGWIASFVMTSKHMTSFHTEWEKNAVGMKGMIHTLAGEWKPGPERGIWPRGHAKLGWELRGKATDSWVGGALQWHELVVWGQTPSKGSQHNPD